MERSYIAFISYRHLPLEMATAKKLHKRIERFLIPKDLRRDGKKRLGLVFRDQDELPISSNLSDNIRQALDNSRFLIVICTPETAKSPWVMREIRYFLQHHDRDHVLAVLADGTPETAFPAPLTELRSEKGELLDKIEPLAANIAADSAAKRARLFRTESLRILASLIGCPYDALFRRELRFRRRRAAAVAAALAVFAAAFIGMLLNRNAEIREQLQQTLINESRTLAALSEQAYREGDYSGALRYALQALPGGDRERPYVAEAEYALSRELDLYRQGVMRYARSMEQESAITEMALSPDGEELVTADEYGVLRCWETGSGTLRWERRGAAAFYLRFLTSDGALLVLDGEGIASLDAETGEDRWRRNDISAVDLAALSADEGLGLVTSYLHGDGSEEFFALLDIQSGQMRGTPLYTGRAARFCGGAAFSEDGALAAMLLQRKDSELADLCLWKLGEDTLLEIDKDLPCSAGATAQRLLFCTGGDLLLACDDQNGRSFLRLYEQGRDWAMRFDTELETEKVVMQTGGAANQFASIDLFDSVGDLAAVGCKHDLYMLGLTDGSIRWHRTLGGFLLSGEMYENACLGLVLSDGTVSFCTDDGFLSDDGGIYNFRSGFDLQLAEIAGESYLSCSVVLTPQDYPQRAALVRFVDNEKMIPVGAFFNGANHVSLIPSPSGALAVAVSYDANGRPVEALLLDSQAGNSENSFPLPEEGGFEDPGELFLTDGGILLSPCGLLDVRRQSFTRAKEEGALISALGYAPERVFSARLSGEAQPCLHLYTDGLETASCPCPDGQWEILTVGGCGYTLLRGENGEHALCSEAGEWRIEELDAQACALGGEQPLLAAWDGERLVIRDLSNGNEVESAELPATTVKLLFTRGEKELLAFSGTGEFSVVRCSDAALLHSSLHGELGLRFRAEGARYALAEAENGNRLLLFYDSLDRSEAICLVYDRECGDCCGAYDAVAAYLPERESVLVCPMMDGIYLSPFRSRAEIITEAENSLHLTVEPGS